MDFSDEYEDEDGNIRRRAQVFEMESRVGHRTQDSMESQDETVEGLMD